jgi:positive regulator of sigma E activity
MIERATVQRVSDREVTLEIGSLAACGGCSACGMFGQRKPQTLRAANRRGLTLHQGDVVEVAFDSGKAVRAAFLLLIVPLFLFLGAFAGAGALGATSEPLKALAGLGGLSVGLALAWLRGRSAAELPEVVRLAPLGSTAPSSLCGMSEADESRALSI